MTLITPAMIDSLTDLECQVLFLALRRNKNQEISYKLKISYDSVSYALKQIYSKLGINCIHHSKNVLIKNWNESIKYYKLKKEEQNKR